MGKIASKTIRLVIIQDSGGKRRHAVLYDHDACGPPTRDNRAGSALWLRA